MKIGVIVHSHTGNTLSVAKKLEEKLLTGGHSVSLERVVAENEDPAAAPKSPLKEKPDTAPYEIIVFAAPVRAFSLSPVMKNYLSQLPAMEGKKACCFVTQHLKYPWLGGNHAISQMKKILSAKGVDIIETGVVNWSHKERERQISDVVEKLGKL